MKKRKRLLMCMKDRLRLLVLLICVVFCLIASVVYAKYLKDIDTNISMDISADGKIELAVVKNADGTYTIQHVEGSRIPAYIRFAVTVNWADDNGNLYYLPPSQYDITADNCDFLDNYYYHKGAVAVNAKIEGITVELNSGVTPPSGFANLYVQILAEGIQCEPGTAVEDAWKASFDGTNWTTITP